MPHFMDFECMDDFKGGRVMCLGIDSPQNPAHLPIPSRKKLESNLLIYQKCFANKQFSPHLDNL